MGVLYIIHCISKLLTMLVAMRAACYVFLLVILSQLSSIVLGVDPSLEDVYNTMNPPMTRDQWHIHDPSRIVATDGMLMIAVTGKAQEDGYKCGLETWYLAPSLPGLTRSCPAMMERSGHQPYCHPD